MQAPKLVVFDLGKVLLDFDYGIAARRIAARSSVSTEEVRQFIDQSPLLARYECGELTSAEFYQEVRRKTGFAGSLEEFGEDFADIFTEVPEIVALQSGLKRDGVRCYVFSNCSELVISFIRRRFPFFQGFDGYIFSYEHRALKPEPRIYEALERQSGQSLGDVLYIDDRRENVAAGAARGWRTVLHESGPKTIQALKELGLKP